MGLFYLGMVALAIIFALIHLAITKEAKTAKVILGIFILYLIFFNVGLAGLWGFIGHVFYPDQTAHYIGWPPGSPFQFEVGMANLALGILGILCVWERGDFWLATSLSYFIFFFGAGLVHIWQVITKHNLFPGNSGAILYIDLILPIVLLILIMIHRRLSHTHHG